MAGQISLDLFQQVLSNANSYLEESVCLFSTSTIHAADLKYRKVVYKSRGLCAIFQLFGAASIPVRLLFEGGLYAMFWVCKTRENSLCQT